MAGINAIAGVSAALVGLLEDSRSLYEPSAAMQIKLFHASDFETPTDRFADATGVSLHLYRVCMNTAMRNTHVRRANDDGTEVKSYFAPLPVDLYYLLTAWSKHVDVQQRLLGWAMRVFHDNPVLPAELINAREMQAFRPGETVELTHDPLSFQDWATIWDKLKPKMQTSAAYVVRMVMIDSLREVVQAPAIQARIFDRIKDGSAS